MDAINELIDWKLIEAKLSAIHWGAIPQSHTREDILTEEEQHFWQQHLPPLSIKAGSRLPYLPISDGRVWVRTNKLSSPSIPPTAPLWIKPSLGDIILFDPRIIHVGGHVSTSKHALLFSYGAPNKLSINHMMHHSPLWYKQRSHSKYQPYISYLKNKNILLK